MATRTDRVEARIEPEHAQRIRFASELLRESLSSFMVQAAVDRAERVIAEHTFTAVDPDYFDRLPVALYQRPAKVPALAKATRRSKKSPTFERR